MPIPPDNTKALGWNATPKLVNLSGAGTGISPDVGKVLGWTSGPELDNIDLDTAIALPADGRTVSTLSEYLANNAVLNVKDFGALGNGSTDDHDAIQATIDAANNGQIIVFPPGIYRTTDSLTVSGTATRLTFLGLGVAHIVCDHNGDGLVLVSDNENYSRHIVRSLYITGPNEIFPDSEYTPPSTGAAICLSGRRDTGDVAAYEVSIEDCTLECFNAGIEMQNAIGCTVLGNTRIAWNQYGIFIDGGQTNANTFTGTMIRENRQIGIYFSGNTDPGGLHATANNFTNCAIESNIAYPSAGEFDDDPDIGGVVIKDSYDNNFTGCYFENHNYAIVIAVSSDQNRFADSYFSPSSVRVGGVLFSGTGIVNTSFTRCTYQGGDPSPNVKFTDLYSRPTQPKNEFVDCAGWKFTDDVTDTGGNCSSLDIFNAKTNQSGGGTTSGLLQLPTYGYANNTSTGSTRGSYDDTDPDAAILNADGYGEIQFGNGVTQDLVITSITNLRPNSFFVLSNLQSTYTVTIQSATVTYGDIQLKNLRTVVLNTTSQTLVCWVNGEYRLIEIGRNFSDRVRGVAQISGSNSFIDVVFSDYGIPDEPNTSYAAFFSVDTTTGSPPAGAWLASAANYATTGFRIQLRDAPGTSNSVYIQWEAVR